MREMKKFSLVTFLVLGLISSDMGAGTAASFLAKLQKKYEGIVSLTADFEQFFRSRAGQMHESGILFVKKPGRMYWEYLKPVPKTFVTDGEKSYFYVPRNNQLIISNLDLQNAQAPLLFLLDKGNLRTDFDAQFEEEEPSSRVGNTMLRLTPKRFQGEFAQVILEVDPASFLIQRLIVVEPLGNRNEYVLKNIRENIRIPDRRFDLKVPASVEVIRY